MCPALGLAHNFVGWEVPGTFYKKNQLSIKLITVVFNISLVF